MNLVAKEAPFVNDRDGVVVLSENAGAHEDLGDWTITVNPFDIEGQAEALHEALTMPPDERRRRAEAIATHVREHDVEAWIERPARRPRPALARPVTCIAADERALARRRVRATSRWWTSAASPSRAGRRSRVRRC